MKRIVLLDTHAIIHRAYHALPDFRSSTGIPTGALYGLSTMIASIIRELKPDYIFACYDLPGNTFRHDAYENYKGTRSKTDDDLITQLISSREIIEALNIPIYDAVGYEADDVIGTISKKFSDKNKYDIIIASGDMDTMQLIEDKHVRVFTLKKGITETILMDEDAVVERFGFKPEYIQDYKGLRGDASDNIPGVPGVGEKTATILIKNFETVENLYKVLKKNPEKLKDAGITDRIIGLLKENEEGAIFSKMLGTIRTDAPVKITIPEKTWQESFDNDLAEKTFKKYEFKNMLNRFTTAPEIKTKNTSTDENNIKNKTNKKGKINIKNEIEDETTDDVNVGLFNTQRIYEVDENKLEEMRLMLWLLDSDKTTAKIETILTWAGVDEVDDAYKVLEERLKKEKPLLWLYSNMEKPLINIVKTMSQRGVLMDKKYLNNLSKNIHKEIEILEKEIIKLAGEDFNLNSPKQLSHILFEVLEFPTKGIKKRKDGMYSTDVATLEKFSDTHPIISKMLEYRELEKLRSTYIDAWPSMLDIEDVLHPEFLISATATGRFSSINPNVQNIPIKGNRGKELRKAFIARDGYSLVAFDYSQIELRIAAILSQDEYLLKVFNDGRDIHNEVAAKVYEVKSDEVTKDMRRHAKVINFGILYGMGSTVLAKEMNITRNEAKAFIDTYFSQFPKVAQYMESIIQNARKLGYTETLFGRRRQLPDLKSNAQFIRSMAERMATNAPVQGTAADLIRLALVNVFNELKQNNLNDKVFPIMQIHDELVFEVKDDVLDEAIKLIKQVMEKPIPKDFIGQLKTVPIITECHYGKNWGDVV